VDISYSKEVSVEHHQHPLPPEVKAHFSQHIPFFTSYLLSVTILCL